MKLVQKQLLKGAREFELVDDAVLVTIKSAFKEKKLSVLLSVLEPEPVLNKSCLEFHSQGISDPLLSLFVNQPNEAEFNVFVEELKSRILQEAALKASRAQAGDPAQPPRFLDEEPPEFEESGEIQISQLERPINAAHIDESVQMLKQYLDAEDAEPLVSALEALKASPQDDACLVRVHEAFNGLGPSQGAVLTYAPYVGILLADHPFKNM